MDALFALPLAVLVLAGRRAIVPLRVPCSNVPAASSLLSPLRDGCLLNGMRRLAERVSINVAEAVEGPLDMAAKRWRRHPIGACSGGSCAA